MSFCSLVAQDPFPLVCPGSAGSLIEVPSAPNGFNSLDPTQDSYEFDLRQMCAKLGSNEYGRPLTVSIEPIVPMTECTSDHIPHVVPEQDPTFKTSNFSTVLLSTANQPIHPFKTAIVDSSFEPALSYEPKTDHMEHVCSVTIGNHSFCLQSNHPKFKSILSRS